MKTSVTRIEGARVLNEILFDKLTETAPPPFPWWALLMLRLPTLWRVCRERRAYFRRRRAAKKMVDAVMEFSRQKMREGPMLLQIFPPLNVTNEELDRVPPTQRPQSPPDLRY